MAVSQNLLVTTQAINTARLAITNATAAVGTGLGNTVGTDLTNAPQQVIAAGANGTIIKSLTVCSDDSAAEVLTFYVGVSGGPYYPIGAVNIPLSSGKTGVIANVDILASTVFLGMPLDAAGRSVIMLAVNDILWCGPQATITAAKIVTVQAQGENL